MKRNCRCRLSYPIGFPHSIGKDTIGPVMVLVERPKHKGVIVHHHGVNLDEFVHGLGRIGGPAPLTLARRATPGYRQGVNESLDTCTLTAAWGASHNHTYKQRYSIQ